MKIRNTFIIFLVSGFWHGANWTFVVWGALNAFYFLPLLLTDSNRVNLDGIAKDRKLPRFKEFSKMALTFGLTVFAWIFFRAESLSHAGSYISTIFSSSLFSAPEYLPIGLLLMIMIFFTLEWISRERQHALADVFQIDKRIYRWGIYVVIGLFILFSHGKQQEFIYFQF